MFPILNKKDTLKEMKKKPVILCVTQCPSHLIIRGADNFCLFQGFLKLCGWLFRYPHPVWTCSSLSLSTIFFWTSSPSACLGSLGAPWENQGRTEEPKCSPTSMNSDLCSPSCLLEWNGGIRNT